MKVSTIGQKMILKGKIILIKFKLIEYIITDYSEGK